MKVRRGASVRWLRMAVAVVLSAGTVQGCATITVSENAKRTYEGAFYSPSIVDYPAVGEVRTIEVGDSLISKDKLTSIPSIDIEQPITHPAENLGRRFTFTVLPGRYVAKGKDPQGVYYEGKAGNVLVDGRPAAGGAYGVYVPASDTHKTEIYALAPQMVVLSYPKENISFVRSTYQQRDELSFRRELVYTGVSQNVVSILYREFSNDMARPAFSQDLKYDLKEGRVVGYRGARFEIVKATNQGLKYKTLKQLD